MANYVFYQDYRKLLVNVLRKQLKISSKVAHRERDFQLKMLRLIASDPDFTKSLMCLVMLDETDFDGQGRQVFIPQNLSLLQMLWRSRMNVEFEDLMEFPRCFTIAWPRGTVINGQELTPCMIWLGRGEERHALAETAAHWLGPVQRAYDPEDSKYGLHLTYGVGAGAHYQVFRISVPEHKLRRCLQSSDDMGKELPMYEGFKCLETTPEERERQHVHLRLVLYLLVYASACPEALIKGWPPEFGVAPCFHDCLPNILVSPKPRTGHGGEHASPVSHWRNAHFRQYPIRRDGTRTKGVVMVCGTMVNAGMDPTTVLEKQRHEK